MLQAYLVYAEKKLTEERERIDHYLDEATRKPLNSTVETQLIIVNMDVICRGMDDMLDAKRQVMHTGPPA